MNGSMNRWGDGHASQLKEPSGPTILAGHLTKQVERKEAVNEI